MAIVDLSKYDKLVKMPSKLFLQKLGATVVYMSIFSVFGFYVLKWSSPLLGKFLVNSKESLKKEIVVSFKEEMLRSQKETLDSFKTYLIPLIKSNQSIENKLEVHKTAIISLIENSTMDTNKKFQELKNMFSVMEEKTVISSSTYPTYIPGKITGVKIKDTVLNEE